MLVLGNLVLTDCIELILIFYCEVLSHYYLHNLKYLNF